MEEASEISKLQLSEKEEDFIGQCWDGVQDSGKLSLDGLSTLCETLGITSEVMELAMTDLGSEDLTVDCDDFMLLMGRMLRSGALVVPQAGDDGAAKPEGAAAGEAPEERADPNEISKLQLSEREEDYIGQCWDGVKKSDRLDMEGLQALTNILGIDAEVINLAVTGLGDADCTMDRGEFTLLMGRLLRSGSLKLPAEPEGNGKGSWMAAMAAQAPEEDEDGDEAPPAAKKAAAKSGNMAWMASMSGGGGAEEDDDEEATVVAKKPAPKAAAPKAGAGMAWMATMTTEGEDVDEDEAPSASPAKAGMAAWMASMSGDAGEDVDEAEAAEAQPAKAGATAWMATMAVDDGEDVDEPEPAPKAKAGAAAWMATMAPDAADAEEAPASKKAAGMSAWMASMAAPEDEDN